LLTTSSGTPFFGQKRCVCVAQVVSRDRCDLRAGREFDYSIPEVPRIDDRAIAPSKDEVVVLVCSSEGLSLVILCRTVLLEDPGERARHDDRACFAVLGLLEEKPVGMGSRE
jgi:hypothetical protein